MRDMLPKMTDIEWVKNHYRKHCCPNLRRLMMDGRWTYCNIVHKKNIEKKIQSMIIVVGVVVVHGEERMGL